MAVDDFNKPIAVGDRVGVVFEVVHIEDAKEVANMTVKATIPAPNEAKRKEYTIHSSQCQLVEEWAERGDVADFNDVESKPYEVLDKVSTTA